MPISSIGHVDIYSEIVSRELLEGYTGNGNDMRQVSVILLVAGSKPDFSVPRNPDRQRAVASQAQADCKIS